MTVSAMSAPSTSQRRDERRPRPARARFGWGRFLADAAVAAMRRASRRLRATGLFKMTSGDVCCDGCCDDDRAVSLPTGPPGYLRPRPSAPWSASPRIGFANRPYAGIKIASTIAAAAENRVHTGSTMPARRLSSSGLNR